LDLQLVEVKPAQPTVQRHRLGRQAANAAEMFDDRTERGHHTNGVVVQLDRAREIRHSRLDGDLRRINCERKRGRNRVVGLPLERIGDHLDRSPLNVWWTAERTALMIRWWGAAAKVG